MRIIIALGGNALLRRREPLTAENQRHNVKIAAKALAPLACEHDVVISHGNGPQVGRFVFASGSMGPRVEAAIECVEQTGGVAAIGALKDAQMILQGNAGTVISRDSAEIVWWE